MGKAHERCVQSLNTRCWERVVASHEDASARWRSAIMVLLPPLRAMRYFLAAHPANLMYLQRINGRCIAVRMGVKDI